MSELHTGALPRIAESLFDRSSKTSCYPLYNVADDESLPPLAKGILAVLNGDVASGCSMLIGLLESDVYRQDALTNLLFLHSHGLIDNDVDRLWHKVAEMPHSIEQVKAYLSLSLTLQKVSADEVYDSYIKPCVLPAVRRRRAKMLVFYHIPKCAGTSVNQLLGKYFYGEQHNTLTPGYIHAPLAALCVDELSEYLPYLSTKHMGTNIFPINNDKYTAFTVFKDPIARLHSMFVQSLESARSGYNLRILPKYNAFWRYWDASTLNEWLRVIPSSLLNAQLSLFAPDLDIQFAQRRVQQLAFSDVLNNGDASLISWLRNEDVDVDALPQGLNASHRPSLTVEEQQILTDAAFQEVAFFNQLKMEAK